LLNTDIISPMVMVATASRRGQPVGIPSCKGSAIL
jgi:hypothetical protein